MFSTFKPVCFFPSARVARVDYGSRNINKRARLGSATDRSGIRGLLGLAKSRSRTARRRGHKNEYFQLIRSKFSLSLSHTQHKFQSLGETRGNAEG